MENKWLLLVLSLLIVRGSLYGQDTLSVSLDYGDVRCHGETSGYISAFPQGGKSPYIYALDEGDFGLDNSFPGLAAGNHELTVVDANFDTISINVMINQPQKLKLVLESVKAETCYQDASGSISLGAEGGVGGYQFALNNDLYTNGNTFKELASGPYVVKVMDANVCEDDSMVVILTTTPVDAFITLLQEVQCQGDSNGVIAVNASGGWGEYHYAINQGPFQKANTFTGLPSGTHQLEILDDSSCSARLEIDLQDPRPLDFEVSIDSLSCANFQNGSAFIQASGGKPPYAFKLGEEDFSFRSNFGNLGSGSYSVQVRDLHNCLSRVDSFTLLNPEPLLANLTGEDPLCRGAQTGSLFAEISGGRPPYTYFWDGNPKWNTLALRGVSSGSHIISIEDAKGCIHLDTIILTEPAERVDLALASQTNTLCERSDGQASVMATGGVEPYTYQWLDLNQGNQPMATGLSAGNYVVEVLDQHGCKDSLTITITTTRLPEASFTTFPSVDDPLRITNPSVSFLGSARFGQEYLWDFGDGVGFSTQLSPSYTYSSPGTYTVKFQLMDPFGTCPVTVEKEITILPVEKLHIPNAFSPNADGSNDLFKVLGEEVANLELAIFNRWGRRVATLNSPLDVWDGLAPDGTPSPPGVYPYQAKITYVSGYTSFRSGTITLIH